MNSRVFAGTCCLREEAASVSGPCFLLANTRTRLPSARASSTMNSGNRAMPSPCICGFRQDVAVVAPEDPFDHNRFAAARPAEGPFLALGNQVVAKAVVLQQFVRCLRGTASSQIVG